MYIAYSLLLGLVALLSLPWWLLQMVRLGKYRTGFSERMGLIPRRITKKARPGGIWIHAVSVGEVLAVSNLVRELKKVFPDRDVLVSTTTRTGQRLARERFGESSVFFLPLDFGFAIRPWLAALQPAMLVLAETEFWPNLLHLASRRGARIAVVNARISDRSLPRYRRFRKFFARVLAPVSLFLAQTQEDAARLVEIGAAPDRVRVSGNLKFDVRPASGSTLSEQIHRGVTRETPMIVCGSTTEGEEELLIAAFRAVLAHFPSAILVLAPRHPERFEKTASLLAESGLEYQRRTTWPGTRLSPGSVFLLDTVGELAAVYSLATIAFVGGSLMPVGGHNILEPAQYGTAVMTGPHTFNFREIVRIFQQGGGLQVVTPEALAPEMIRLLREPARREQLGNCARRLFEQNTGATSRTMQELSALLSPRAQGAR